MIFEIYRQSWESDHCNQNPVQGTEFDKYCKSVPGTEEIENGVLGYEWSIRIDVLEDLIRLRNQLGCPIVIRKNNRIEIRDEYNSLW